MFRNRLGSVFMIYYFNAIKSLVDTKAKNSLTSYPAAGYLRGHCGPAFPLRRSKKGILILLTELVEGNNGKDKNSNYNSPPPFCWQSFASMTDCMINDTFPSRLSKMGRFL